MKIDFLLGDFLSLLNPREAHVMRRVIRSIGDLDLVGTLRFSKNALTVGPELVRKGVLVDTRMAKAGLGNLGIYVEPRTRTNKYFSQDIVESWREVMNGKAVMIGTSPLALGKLLELINEGFRPGLVIGVPVGFVNALRLKYMLSKNNSVEYITNISVKGGVSLGVSLVKALMEIE
ncbi:precorrin-8X methylmutase [Metallosphaera tengchongensis]|nr:precorrin-8X methylmutase [Metallosphaera tengchongensis]